MSPTAKILQLVRWQDWGPGKITLLWGLTLYIALAHDLAFEKYILTFMVFLPFAMAQAAAAYVLNEWSDRDLDRKQFKHNIFNGLSSLERLLTVGLVGVAALVTGAPFLLRPAFVLLWAAWALLAGCYSLEPLRLKKHGLVGFLALLAAQWFLPVLITFVIFEVSGGIELWALALALTFSGAALDLDRARLKRSRQVITGSGTFATGLSGADLDRLCRLVRILDILAIGLYLTSVTEALDREDLPYAGALGVGLALPYAVLVLAALKNLTGLGDKSGDPSGAAGLLHAAFTTFAIPVVAGLGAALRNPQFGFVLAIFLLWQYFVNRPDFTGSWKATRLRESK